MRAWLMRSMLRWRKAVLPQDEEARLEAVYRLGLLDTAAEESSTGTPASPPPRWMRRLRW